MRFRFSENVALLGYYAGSIRNFLPTFPVKRSVLEMGPILAV